jgi:hypothetical protein
MPLFNYQAPPRSCDSRPPAPYARASIGFRWNGCEEGDQVEGERTAELLHDGTIEIEFAYHNGYEAVLKAKQDPSSTAC